MPIDRRRVPASFIMSVTASDSSSSSISTPPSLSGYRGRFAPSPSGPLHFGSLVTALASYLDAKAHQGVWLVRMEDVDPPREQPGAAKLILHTLEDHGLEWDESVLYQSQRYAAYQAVLEHLQQHNLAYPCRCSRHTLATMGGIYDGRCRQETIDLSQPHSLRLKLYDLPAAWGAQGGDTIEFDDIFQGHQSQNLRTQAGDQILKRRDGFYAYQLAVVVDDIEQRITHIVRGSDLLEVTGRQLRLFELLQAPLPLFGHLPLALQPNGQKMSKQNQAKPIDSRYASRNLWHALTFLGQNPPEGLAHSSTDDILRWGIEHWQPAAVRGLGRVYIPE